MNINMLLMYRKTWTYVDLDIREKISDMCKKSSLVGKELVPGCKLGFSVYYFYNNLLFFFFSIAVKTELKDSLKDLKINVA